MAFNLENMTVDYKKLLNIVPTQRMQLAQSGAINDLIGALSPGQLVNLFPRYYRDQLPDVGQTNKYASGLDVALSGAPLASKSGGGVTTYGNVAAKAIIPEEKAVKEIFEKAGLNKFGSGATSAVTDTKNRIISTANTNLSPQERALLDTIAYGESPNYNTIAGGETFASFEDHPRTFGSLGSTAAGRYQFVKGTWDDTVAAFNRKNPDNPITDFSPANQDRAALFLAQQDYRRRTGGRDLNADLQNPPQNFGELLKYGLGGSGDNTTWQAFQKMADDKIQNLFESNYERNIGYVKEIEADAQKIKDNVIAKFDPSMIGQLDQKLQTWYNSASEIQKKKFEHALEKLGTEQFNDVMKRQAVNTATLQAVSATPIEGSPLMLPVGGTMSGKSIASQEDVPFSGGSYGSRSFGGPRGTNQLHTGVDIPGQPGDPVLAVDNGVIKAMRKSPSGYGYTLDVQYSDGSIHRMAHLGTNDSSWEEAFAEGLKVGDTISAGQKIGTLGYSGNAGAEFPHVHYEVINPEYYEKYEGRPPGRISGRTEASFEELQSGRIDPREWYAKRQEEYVKQQQQKVQQEAEAIAQADPVSATQNLIENNPAAANSAPAMATGGLMDVPPGENVEIRNRDTKEILAYANDRENIRVEPGELEGSQQAPMITQEDTQRLEVPMQQQQVNLPRPPVPDTTDMNFAPIMMADTHYTPSSYERATLSATLRPQKNIHFAPSKHT
jgi:murein DD-endopeptidase MepM/ murein hydrolase activator NlpD